MAIKKARHDSRRQGLNRFSSLQRVLLRDIHSLWLFTLSDIKTIVVPQSIFGILNAIHAETFGLPTQPYADVIVRIPLTFLWVWANLLPFNINNQRQPLAIAEDSLNKPWRPLPLRRITPDRAWSLMLVFYLAAVVLSYYAAGSTAQCVALIVLGTWYNCLGGADAGPVLRNLINAAGFLCFSTGAMGVAYGNSMPVPIFAWTMMNKKETTTHAAGGGGSGGSEPLLAWIAIIGAIVFSTVQSQDLADQEGDLLRQRRTLPLVIGDTKCRLSLCLLVPIWSLFVSVYWQCHPVFATIVALQGAVIAYRTWTKRSIDSDKKTFRLWNLWLIALYTAPMFARKLWTLNA